MLGLIVGGAVVYVFVKLAFLPPREIIVEVARGSTPWIAPQDTLFWRGNQKPEKIEYELDPVNQTKTAIISWPGGYLQRAQVRPGDGQILHPYFLQGGSSE